MGQNLVFACFGYADKAVGAFCRTLGRFLQNIGRRIPCIGRRSFLVKHHHFITEIAQPCDKNRRANRPFPFIFVPMLLASMIRALG
jgi:hypothetical protein